MSAYTVSDFKRDVRMGTYGDGGYPLFFCTPDGDTFHPKCARKDAKDIIRALMDGDRGAVSGHGVNWESPDLYCDACGDRIESAYAEDYVTRKGTVDGEECAVCLADASVSILDRDGCDTEDPYEAVADGWKPRAYVDGAPLLIPVDQLDPRGYVTRSPDAIPQWGEIGAAGQAGSRYKLLIWRS